jgi:arylsulfatase A-like enzyme
LQTVVTTDFLPTVMEMLGVERPPQQQSWAFDGRSILPLLRNDTFRWKDSKEGDRSIGIGFSDPKLNIINGWGFCYGRWKYVEGSASCKEKCCHRAQLYDLENDIGERHDLADEHPAVLVDLQIRPMEWHESVTRSRRDESKCQHVKDLALPRSIEDLKARP